MIVKQLDQVIAAQADRKKDEAVKKEGPVLDQSLEVPPPPGGPRPDSLPSPKVKRLTVAWHTVSTSPTRQRGSSPGTLAGTSGW